MPSKEEYLGEGGWPSPSNAHWLPWIQTELSRKEILSQAPEMPRPYDPDYQSWLKVFEQFAISNESIFVGHSCGGGFLLRYFSEHPELKPKKIILVAPWTDPAPHELTNGFFDFEIDPALTQRTELHVFISSDDGASMLSTVDTIEKSLPDVIWHRFTGKRHFTERHLGTKAFPELLEAILK